MGIRVCYYSYPYRDKVAGSVRISVPLGRQHRLVERPEVGIHYAVHAQFSRLRRMEMVDPWPSFEIEWKDHRKLKVPVLTRRFHPAHLVPVLGSSRGEKSEEEFAAVATELLERLREDVGDSKVKLGWLEEPDIGWEAVDSWPSGSDSPAGPAYRSTGERVVASRPPARAFEALLVWLSSSPEKPLRRTPRELALTWRYLYIRAWDGRPYRIPRDAARVYMEVGDYGDKIFVFGRRAFLVLPYRKGCEVAKALTSSTTRVPSPGR